MMLTATDQKPKKSHKEVILPTITSPKCQCDAAASCHNFYRQHCAQRKPAGI